jgi:hypothetical protein
MATFGCFAAFVRRTVLGGSVGLARWLRVVSGSFCLVCCSTAVQAQAAKPPPATASSAKALPANAAELDKLLSQREYAKLNQIFSTDKFDDAVLNMNWQQARLPVGGTFLSIAFMASLDRVSTALGDVRGAETRKTAILLLLYTYELILIDGQRCKDVSAPGHRKDQLLMGFPNFRKSIPALSDEDMDKLLKMAIQMEGLTAPMRNDDDYLCRGGLTEIQAGLKKYGDNSLREVPTPPGGLGKTMEVKTDPDFKPEFLAKDIWLPKQAEFRAKMPDILKNLVSGLRKK